MKISQQILKCQHIRFKYIRITPMSGVNVCTECKADTFTILWENIKQVIIQFYKNCRKNRS